MTESHSDETAPVGKNSRSRRSGQTGDYVPNLSKSGLPTMAGANREAKAPRKASDPKRSVVAQERRAARKARLQKHKTGIVVFAVVVVTLLAAGTVEAVSAAGGDPITVVEQYVAAMNQKDPSVFANQALFPRDAAISLLPESVLSEIDTSIVGATMSIKVTGSVAEATISGKNLKQPIVLNLKKITVWEGPLLTGKWEILSQLPTVTFSAKASLPADTAITVGRTSIGNSGNADFVTLIATTYASPIGVLEVSAAATATRAEAKSEFSVAPGDNKVEFGEGEVKLTSVFSHAVAASDFSGLKDSFASEVEVLVAPTYHAGLDGLGVIDPVTSQRMSASEALTALENVANGIQWQKTIGGESKRNGTGFLITNMQSTFATSNTVWAFGLASAEDGEWAAFIAATPDDNGQITKIWVSNGLYLTGGMDLNAG
jgi:hypothetical protein